MIPVPPTSEQIALMLNPWLYPYYLWSTAWSMWWINYCTFTELLAASTRSKPPAA
jgi:hypothetical protein